MAEPKMNTSVMAVTVKPSGSTISNGTPGKASGWMPANAPFMSEGIDSEDHVSPWPSLPQYWNVNGGAQNTDKSNRQP